MPRVVGGGGESLRLPQARVLAVLARGSPPPSYSRQRIQELAGITPLSGSVTRALNGVGDTGSVNLPHPGLVALGLVETVTYREESPLGVVTEHCYRITPEGRSALADYLARNGPLPPMRDRGRCVNDRYRCKEPPHDP